MTETIADEIRVCDEENRRLGVARRGEGVRSVAALLTVGQRPTLFEDYTGRVKETKLRVRDIGVRTVEQPARVEVLPVDRVAAPLGPGARTLAALVADGVDVAGVRRLRTAMAALGVRIELLAPAAGTVRGAAGDELSVDHAIDSVDAARYAGVVVPCGRVSVETLGKNDAAVRLVADGYRHAKTIAAFGAGRHLLCTADVREPYAHDADVVVSHGVITSAAASADVPARLFDEIAVDLAPNRAWEVKSA